MGNDVRHTHGGLMQMLLGHCRLLGLVETIRGVWVENMYMNHEAFSARSAKLPGRGWFA